MRILVLGGTGEARALAARLVADGHDVVYSLAGATAEPLVPVGRTRVGGFGGAAGLIDYGRVERIDAIADATHPFAARISSHAAAAARALGIGCVRLERPPWRSEPGDLWIVVRDADEAAQALPANARVLVTIGRKGLEPLFGRGDLTGVVRTIEMPGVDLPPSWLLLRARPPFGLEAEQRLFEEHRITHLVTKNAGGSASQAKITAARLGRIPVVMIARPAKPPVPTAGTVEGVVRLLCA